jgi:putative tricarboxylic transport membrane protein
MTSDTSERPSAVPSARPWWLAAAIIGLGAFWLYGATLLPQTAAYAKIGPGLYLTIAGIGLVVLGILLAIQIARGETFESQDAEDAMAGASAHWPALLTVLAAAAVPMYTMQRFGFVVSSALMFALTTMAFGSRKLPLDIAIGAAVGAIAWFGFRALGVDLGPLWKLPNLAQLLPFGI